MKTAFSVGVNRLARRAWADLVARRAVAGLFFGLLPALAVAVLAGTLRLPVPPLPAAAALAVLGLAVGITSALAVGVNRRQMLLHADAALGSHETLTTAQELQRGRGGAFAQAIVEDAAALLSRSSTRALLGPLRLRFAPYAAAALLVTAGALAFPVDLRGLFPRPAASTADLAQIGEDLRSQGERLAQAAQGEELGRTLELSQELAQLGKDLAARRITPDDALDRMSELESGLGQEYQLRMQQAKPGSPTGTPGPGSGPASPGSGTSPGTAESRSAEASGEGNGTEDPGLNDLGRALDRLRQAQRELGGEGGGSDQAEVPRGPHRQQPTPPSQPGQGLGGGSGKGTPSTPDKGSGGGQGPSGNERPGEAGGAGVGTLPAPEKRGPPTDIAQGSQGPGLQAQGNAASDDATRLLARALPEWTGSRLPEASILHEYSRQAESALSRDEVPLSLRQSVKEYFTEIGITK